MAIKRIHPGDGTRHPLIPVGTVVPERAEMRSLRR
jgi:hypothetical protein